MVIDSNIFGSSAAVWRLLDIHFSLSTCAFFNTDTAIRFNRPAFSGQGNRT